MPPDSLRIIFMGTPELAAHILEAIITAGYQVAAVVTAPDRPAGRGRKVRQSAVKLSALKNNIPVLQPENLKAPSFEKTLKEIRHDIQVVVAFRMLPETIWKLPPKGCFNLHASLLPDYRGAAPINWTIINGEKETGVTTFLIDHQIDTGNILLQQKIPLRPFETAGSLHEKVKKCGAKLTLKTIDLLKSGQAKPIKQETLANSGKKLHNAPKIHKEDRRIWWNAPCADIVNKIHGLSPYPGAFCEVETKKGHFSNLKIFKARPLLSEHNHQSGTILTDNKSFLHFATPDGYVEVTELQLEGKKRMHTEELLRGFRFETGF